MKDDILSPLKRQTEIVLHFLIKCKVYEIDSRDTVAYASLGNCVTLVYEISLHFIFFITRRLKL